MGILIDGVWHQQPPNPNADDGRFVRHDSSFRHWVTADGRPGPKSNKSFRAEPGRYRLYVSLACPWAHRTLIMRRLKGLEPMIPLAIVHWRMLDEGWTFESGPGVQPDPDTGIHALYELYQLAEPRYSGKVTVPVLWDTQERTIVNNESSEIIRMFNQAFDQVGAAVGDYYPEALRPEIDRYNDWIYNTVNNGVYKAGFATTQEAYEEAAKPLFETLNELDKILQSQRFLCGDVLTEADWRLFTTLIRYDPVYYSHFKCNQRRIKDYPGLWRYVQELYHWPGLADTVNFEHIKHHYYESHRGINPSGIVPLGPDLGLDAT